MKKSNDSLQLAMFELGKIYVQEVENCNLGTATLEELRTRFPAFEKMDEVLFNLYFCYNKNGDKAKADAIKKLMNEKHGGSDLTTIINTGKNPKVSASDEATKTYEKIYDLFIEGKFDQAIADKKTADAKYGKIYWTPQLLYIESVYYIKQRDDSTAKNVLTSIVSQFPNTPIAARAANLLDVLSRRAQIEEELRNMNVTRDTSGTYRPPVVMTQQPPKPDSLKTTPPVVTNPKPPVVTDTIATKPPVVIPNSPYRFNPAEAQYVVLVLNKVDPVFVNEAKNAFVRFNRNTFYNKTYTADLLEIDAENKLLMMSPFKDTTEAMGYIDAVRPRTAAEILPWLKGGKYSFLVVSESNLELLKVNKNLETYKTFINQYFPGKF
jgi:hypothetical protein